jgi:hypothetical protein
MLAPQDVSVYLNNALRASHQQAELNSDAGLPEVIHDMPEVVSGRFLGLDSTATQEIAAAWKKVIILNRTEVLYTFTFDAASGEFTARKR